MFDPSFSILFFGSMPLRLNPVEKASCMLLLCGNAAGKRCPSNNAMDHRILHAEMARIQHILKTGGWVGGWVDSLVK